MIVDFRQLDHQGEFDADICIIGAGAAGIAIAREFIGSKVKILLLESGGWHFEDATQDLYKGDVIGHDYYELDNTRLRYFGGSTNHWGGQCAPLSPIDFEARPWVPHSGWPIGTKQIAPYYDRAYDVVGLRFKEFGPEVWQALDVEPPDLTPGSFTYQFFQFTPDSVRFGEVYGNELEAAENITVLLHANATNLAASEDGHHVTHLEIQSLDGRRGRVRARTFIVACGGIDNARLLLASNDVVPAGLGNERDLVGRFFMEHLEIDCARIAAADQTGLLDVYGFRYREDVRYRASKVLADALQRRNKTLNIALQTIFTPREDTSIQAYRRLRREIVDGVDASDDIGNDLYLAVTGVGDILEGAYRREVLGKEPLPEIENIRLLARSEQAPNPESRIVLSADRDALGVPRANLDWQLTDLDRQTIRFAAEEAAIEFGKHDLGRVRIADWLTHDKGAWPDYGDGFVAGRHHMGTTRMGDDPATSVVDRNCRVHSVDNLYVAGSSVFPTGGFVNPTFTLVALALRLADHLQADYA